MHLNHLNKQVHVWHLDPDALDDEKLLTRLLGLLSSEEKTRRARFRFQADRHRYLVSHALVRCVLSLYQDLAPSAWRFARGQHGKPEISNPDPPPLRFNLTHTRGSCACIVTLNDACGIDVEKVSHRHDPVRIAARMFSPAECEELARLTGQNQLEYFFRHWTLREAYVKARGIGLSFPTTKLGFTVTDSEKAEIRFAGDLDDRAGNWALATFRPGPEHIAAAAVHKPGSPEKELRVREFVFRPDAWPKAKGS